MPGNSFKDKALAARAGASHGKHKKTKQWEQLGEFITQKGAQKAMRILNEMPDEDFLDQYQKLLSYFKPKLSSAQVEAKADININIKEPEWNDGNGH